MSERITVSEYRSNEEFAHKCIEQLYADASAYLAYATQLSGDHHAGEDIVQQAYMQTYSAILRGGFDCQKKLQPWFYSIITRVAIDRFRKEKRHVAVHLDDIVDSDGTGYAFDAWLAVEADPSDIAAEREIIDIVRTAIRSLPQRLRNVTKGVYVDGRTMVEEASRSNVPSGTVKSRLHDARKLLRRSLGHLN